MNLYLAAEPCARIPVIAWPLALLPKGSQRAKYLLIKEYSLNHNMKPYII